MITRLKIKRYCNKLGVDSILQSKPPQKKLPETLIYNTGNDYIMFSTKTGEQLGRMNAYITEWPPGKSYYPKEKESYTCLYIDGLIAFKKMQGVGKKFIEFAKGLSKNSKAKGKINILAWCLDDSKVCPQIFYHKMGFTTANKKHLAEILRLEKTNTKTPRLFGNWNVYTNMYLEAAS